MIQVGGPANSNSELSHESRESDNLESHPKLPVSQPDNVPRKAFPFHRAIKEEVNNREKERKSLLQLFSFKKAINPTCFLMV